MDVQNQPLISIIVPVYNVEQYLPRCIDSIRNQTYKNIEIILVDDGSTDNSGCLCDKYATIDSRIIVIHQENQGLSGARNSGINVCSGEYLGFIDSDDFIHPEMYRCLFQDILTYGTKLAFCHPNMCKGNIPKVEINKPSKCFDKEYVILRSMIENIWWSAWTKLYHHSLFEGIRYPIGKTNEDYLVTMYIYDRCDQIVINYNQFYNYCIRENSICTSPFNLHKLDKIDISRQVLKYMESRPSSWYKAAEFVFFGNLLSCYGELIHSDKKNLYQKEESEILRQIRQYLIRELKNPHLLWKQKILCMIISICPCVYKLLNMK